MRLFIATATCTYVQTHSEMEFAIQGSHVSVLVTNEDHSIRDLRLPPRNT